MHYLAKLIPFILFYLFFAFPDDFLMKSISPLGRFIAVVLILFYSCVRPVLGILMCMVIIGYYNLPFVVNTCRFYDKEMFQYQEAFSSKEEEFRQEYCVNGSLTKKQKQVRKENTEHIFENVTFTDGICNVCDPKCGFKVQEILKNEQEIVYPKGNDDWVMSVWRTWFSYDIPMPYDENHYSNL